MATSTQWLPSGTNFSTASTGTQTGLVGGVAPNIAGQTQPDAFTNSLTGLGGTTTNLLSQGGPENKFFGGILGDVAGFAGSAAENLLSALYGSKYQVPNPVATANAAATGNAGNLGAIGAETLGADTLSSAGAALPFQLNLPNYEGMLTQNTANVGAELNGQLPQDVQNLLAQQAAERGVSTGQGVNSPNSTANYLQSLGLTSLNLDQLGQTGLSSLIAETPTGPAFNPSAGFVTPQQQQAATLAANQEAAAPDPQAAGLLKTFTSLL